MVEQLLLAAGGLAFIAYILSTAYNYGRIALAAVLVGCTAILTALLARIYITGQVPWTSLYETAAILGLIAGIGTIAAAVKDEPRSLRFATSLATIFLTGISALLWEAPAPLPTSLDSKWLLVHVPVAIASYGLFTCAAASSVAYLYYGRRNISDKDIGRLDQISWRCIVSGLALLVTAIVMGSIWAHATWGSYWSWDPKETWSLITAMVYGLYCVLRLRGMKGEGSAYLSIVGFLCLIFTYIGVSYVIPGLHSYR